MNETVLNDGMKEVIKNMFYLSLEHGDMHYDNFSDCEKQLFIAVGCNIDKLHKRQFIDKICGLMIMYTYPLADKSAEAQLQYTNQILGTLKRGYDCPMTDEVIAMLEKCKEAGHIEDGIEKALLLGLVDKLMIYNGEEWDKE